MSASDPHARDDDATPWWRDFHDEHLAAILLERGDPGEVAATLDFLIDALALSPGAHVLDQCCGIGSLALPLARRGFRVSAVDRADNYIERAAREAAAAGVSIDYVAADAGDYRPRDPCDGAFNWWTSFGYADRDEDNLRMLRRAFDALRPGAFFILDTMNIPGVLRRFQPHVITRRPVPGGELVLLRETDLDLAGGVMRKRWTYLLPDGTRLERRSRVRIYMPHELRRFFEEVGFGDVELLGGIDRAPLGLDDLRCLVRARRPL